MPRHELYKTRGRDIGRLGLGPKTESTPPTTFFRRELMEQDLSFAEEMFPKAVRAILDEDKIVLHFPSGSKDALEIIQPVSLFPPDSQTLSEGWRILAAELSKSKHQLTNDLARPVRAFFLATSLLSQIELPLADKIIVKKLIRHGITRSELVKEFNDNLPPLVEREKDGKSLSSVKRAVRMFQGTIDRLLPAVPKNKDEAELLLRLTDAFLITRTTSLYGEWVQTADEDFKKWDDQVKVIELDDQVRSYISQLLLENRLEDISEYTRLNFWLIAISQRLEGSDTQALVEYFFSHPDMQAVLWQIPGTKEAHLEAIGLFVSTLGYIAGQDEETIDKFFQTLQLPQERRTKTMALRRLIDVVASLAAIYPDLSLENFKSLKRSLRKTLEREGLFDGFSNEINVLEDSMVGVLYESIDGQARARVPKVDETQEMFTKSVEELAKMGHHALYTSKAPWPQLESKQTNVDSKPAILSGEIVMIEPWGEVQIPTETARILDWLQEKTATLGLSENSLIELVSKYGKSASGRDTVIPYILPDQHPLYPLRKLGIVGIDHDGETVRFIIDGQETGIETLGPQKLLLIGRLNPTLQDLELPNTPDDFTYSPLHLLLTAAALFGKTPAMLEKLTKDEIASIHGLVKSLKQKAKELGLPPLVFEENEVGKNPSQARVRLPIGKKTAYLTFGRST